MSYKIEYKIKIIADLNLFYRVFGSDNASHKILILHGWNTVGSQSWEPFIQLFQEKVDKNELQIIAPDMPGFARSESPKTVWQAEDYANHLSLFIRSQNLDTIMLIGHSFGGAVSTVIASQHPEITIKHLFLVAPALVRNWGESQSIKQRVTKYGKKFFELPILKPLFQTTRKVWYKLIGSLDYTKTKGIMTAIMSQVVKHDIQYALKDINVPTTIVWGTEDKMTPFVQAEIVKSQIAKSKLIILNGVNHGIHLNAADQLFNTIRENIDL